MPIRNKRVKQETRVVKINQSCKRLVGRLKTTELSACGKAKDVKDASLVFDLSDSQPRRESTSRNSAKNSLVVGKVTSQCQEASQKAGLLTIFSTT
jgi:hypothetical protein